MGLTVYADFNCLDCYLASRRVDALRAAGLTVDWRAVEHRPDLPVGGTRVPAAEQDRMAGRAEELDKILLPAETLPWLPPPIVARTEAAVSAYAESYGAGVGNDVRRLLFEMYWLQRADIGNPAVLRTPVAGPVLRGSSDADPLRESGYVVGADRGPITTSAYRRIRSWRTEWQELGCPTLPVVLDDGATLSGLDALLRLGKQLGYADARPDPDDLPDPRRYPPVSVRPQASWVSEIGGRWRNAYRLTGVR